MTLSSEKLAALEAPDQIPTYVPMAEFKKLASCVANLIKVIERPGHQEDDGNRDNAKCSRCVAVDRAKLRLNSIDFGDAP